MAGDKDEEDDGLLPALDEVVDQVLPEEPKFKTLKDDIWVELAEIYYKYEADNDQKRAFRRLCMRSLIRSKWIGGILCIISSIG